VIWPRDSLLSGGGEGAKREKQERAWVKYPLVGPGAT
jgi:hypothetical protein